MRPFGSPGTCFGAKNPKISGRLLKDGFKFLRSLQTAIGRGEEKYVAFGTSDGRQTATVFLYFPLESLLSFFLSDVFFPLSRDRPRSRCWAAGAAGEERLDELCDREPARAPGVEPLREGDREGERLLRRLDPFERWEEELGREEALELPRADPFPDPFMEPRPLLWLRLRFPSP